MLQTHQNPMSTNIKPNDQFFDIPNPSSKTHSLIDNLAVSLKSSLHTVWNYLKTIDLKLPRSQNKSKPTQGKQLKSGNISGQQTKPHNLEPNKTASQTVLLQKSPTSQKRAILPQPIVKDSAISKKQRLHNKKQEKKVISFDDFMTQQQRKLNESYIRKNIQQKKTLNKSTLSQQQQNNPNSSAVIGSKQNLLNISQQVLGKSTIKSAQKPVLSLNNINNSVLNPNNQTILNISDIDSQCNFNILNNSDLYDFNDKILRAQDNDEEENDHQDTNQKDNQRKIQPKLQLSDYPFMTRAKKIQLPKTTTHNKHTYSSTTNNIHTYSSTNTKTQLNKPSSKSIPQSYIDFIDVDNQPQIQKKYHFPAKRALSPSAQPFEAQIRKQLNPSYPFESDDESDSDSTIKRCQYFDQLLEKRYDFMIEDMLKNGTKNQPVNKDQPLSLKDDFAKYISKNFGAMIHVKNRIQNNAKQTQKPPQHKHTSTSQSQQRKQKLSEILKPLDLSPQIQRKKLYNFSRQCQSKINISFELQKSVREDRQRQAAEEMRKKKEQEDRRRKQEEERMRRQMQEKRRLQELERKRIQQQQQQQALRLAEQLKAQKQKQKQEQQKNKQQQQNQQQLKQSQAQQLKSSHSKTVKQDAKSDDDAAAKELKSSDSKQSNRPLKFSQNVKPFQLIDDPNEDKEPKETQSVLLKKASSLFDPKPTQSENKLSSASGSKSPEAPSPLEKKETPKDQKDKKTTKYNPFMASLDPAKNSTTLLQEIINSKKDDNSLFKTVITNTPATLTSPQRKPNPPNPNSFMSPVNNKHNTSHYSNLDSSMCEESQSNIGQSGHLPNQANNLNGSFLNNSFSSQQQNSGLFGNPTSNPLFSANTGGSLFGNAYNPMNSGSMFGNPSAQQQKPPTPGNLFGNTQMNMFGSSLAPSNMAATQAVSKVPSFMQNHPTIAPGINPQNAVSLFNQRSPTKNESSSLFTPTPSVSDKRSVTRRDRKTKEERIR